MYFIFANNKFKISAKIQKREESFMAFPPSKTIFTIFAAELRWLNDLREIVLKYIRLFLPLLFITYYSGVSLYTHVHIEQGTTIVHAHPFATSDGAAEHQHSSLAEIQLYHVLSTIVAADGVIHPLQLNYQAIQIAELSASLVYPTHLQAIVGRLYLRAPPSCSC